MEAKKIKNRTELVVYILAILTLIGVVNYLATHWFKRIDMTQGKEYSISHSTKKVLKGLNDVINIKVYFSKNLPPNLHNTITDVKDILSEYQAYAGKNLHITWEDPATDNNAKQMARNLGIPEIQMKIYEKDKEQLINAYLGIAVLYEDKKEALPVVQNLQNLEYDLTMAVMKVSRKTTPKVGIVKVDTLPQLPPQYQQQMQSNPENQTTEQKLSAAYELLRNNYDVLTVDLSNGTPIDSTIKTIIVPGTATLNDKKLFEIDQFFMKGGNLVVLSNAVDVNFQYGVNAVPVESGLFKMLENYGVKIEKNLILDASCGQVEIPQRVGPFNMSVPVPYPYFVRLGAANFAKGNPAVSPLSDVVFPWVSSLSLLADKSQNDLKSTILARSSKKSWQVSGTFDLNPQQKWIMPAPSELKEYNLAVFLEGKFKSFFDGKPIPSANNATPSDTLSKINLTTTPASDPNRKIIPSNNKGRLVVIGDEDFVTGQNATQQNIAMFANIVDWFSLDDNLISIRTRAISNRTMDSDMLKSSSGKPNLIRIINLATMPIVVIIIGLLIFLRRREVIPVSSTTTAEKLEDKK